MLKEGIGEDHANQRAARQAAALRVDARRRAARRRLARRLRRADEGRPGGDLLRHRRHARDGEEQPAARDLPQEGHRGAAARPTASTSGCSRTSTSSTASRCRASPRARSTSASSRTRPRRSRPRKPPTAFKPTLERLKDALKDRAKDVRVTTRLVDSPACLVVEEGDMSGHLARLLKQAGQGAPKVAADPRGQRRARAGQAARVERALRRPGQHPVRPGAARRRRPARGSGGLRQARQRAAARLTARSPARGRGSALRVTRADPSGGSAIASSCSRSRVHCSAQYAGLANHGKRSGTPGRSSAARSRRCGGACAGCAAARAGAARASRSP